MRDVVIHGALAKMLPQDRFTFSVLDPREAFSALFANFPATRQYVYDNNWHIFYGDPQGDEWESLSEEELTLQRPNKEIHIVPAIEGSGGNGGIIKTVVGVAIVGAALFFSGGTLAAPLFAVLGTSFTFGNLAFLGAAIALSGISQMLTPTPEVSTRSTVERNDPASRPSFLFQGAVNSTEEGGAVPVIYGQMRVGSTVISSGLEIEQI